METATTDYKPVGGVARAVLYRPEACNAAFADGVCTAFPAKAEAMYLPDVFGLSATQEITVQ